MTLAAHDHAFARFRATGLPGDLAPVFDATAVELHRVARHLVRSTHEADDLVQSTFLAAIEGREDFEAGEPVLPWLLGILANRARRLHRGRRRRPDPARVRSPEPAPDPAKTAEAVEVDASVREALTKMPEPYGSLLNLHLRHGLSPREIADHVERPAGSVRKQLSRGMDRLRQALPASLAGATTVSASLRSLDGVRTAVLAAAESPAVASAAAGGVAGVAGLTAAGKMGIGVGTVLTLLLGAAIWTSRDAYDAEPAEHAPRATLDTTRAEPDDVRPATADASQPTGTAIPEPLARTVVETPAAKQPRLLVTVRDDRSDAAVERFRLRLQRAPNWNAKANEEVGALGIGPGGSSVNAAEVFEEIDEEAGLGSRFDPFVDGVRHAEGRYSKETMPRGSFCVQVFPEDDALLPSDLRVVEVADDEPARLDFVLRPALTRTMRLVDATGEPVTGSTVELLRPVAHDPPRLTSVAPTMRQHPDHRPDALLVRTAETDDSGAVELRGPSGLLAIRISGEGHAPTVIDEVDLTREHPLTITVHSGAVVEGTIADFEALRALLATEGDPTADRWLGSVHHPTVELREVESGERFPPNRTAFLERHGRFCFDDVPPGHWQVRLLYSVAQPASRGAMPDRGWLALGTLRAMAGDTHRIDGDAAALRAAEWSGRVTVDGEPWIGGSSGLRFRGHGGVSAKPPSTRLGIPATGEYRVRLVAGSYTVAMTGSAPDGGRRYPLRLAAGQIETRAGLDAVHDFALATASLSLRVLDADGAPAPGAHLELDARDAVWRMSVQADERGEVHVPRVPRTMVTVWEAAVYRASTDELDGPVQTSSGRALQALLYVDLRDGAPTDALEVQLP